ncbi:hypothetical protein F887_03575 [Acinetobacter sp. NIPH 2100]|nr:hypothetical protein F887_03575 [Acinetobacter sp. NIPH 2100]
MSIKGQQLQQYCAQYDHIQVHLPDLNRTPDQVLMQLSQLIENFKHDHVVLLGSSLGGFYTTYLVAKYACPAVLINPAMQPWRLFEDLFGIEQIPLKVTESWTLDADQLQQLQSIADTKLNHADKILVLLQQGDEVLDYREAQRYYSAVHPSSLILTDADGNHAMDDFEEKLPLILEFLSAAIQ